jgi:hypothetical protein
MRRSYVVPMRWMVIVIVMNMKHQEGLKLKFY